MATLIILVVRFMGFGGYLVVLWNQRLNARFAWNKHAIGSRGKSEPVSENGVLCASAASQERGADQNATALFGQGRPDVGCGLVQDVGRRRPVVRKGPANRVVHDARFCNLLKLLGF
jgi:hypothetical protein